MDKSFLDIAFWAILGIAIGIAAYYIFVVPGAAPPVNHPVQNTTNQTQNQTIIPPALVKVDATIINATGCPMCSASGLNESLLIQVLPQFNTTLNSVKYLSADSPEAAALISKYNIDALPATILSPEGTLPDSFTQVWSQGAGTIESDGKLVYRAVAAPYYNITDKNIVGLVDGIAINATGCPACLDAGIYFTSLESVGHIYFKSATVLQPDDPQAKSLIASHNITKLPALLMSGNINVYPFFTQRVLSLGKMEGGWFVLQNVSPPYVDLADNNSIKGLVSAIYLVNQSCTGCLNVTQLSDYLTGSGGVYIANSTTYDISSINAKNLVKKYNITAIPSVLYSPEARLYPGFSGAWTGINSTVASDGWFIFRSYSLLSGAQYQNVSSTG
jgi:uncharacterized protein with FMN-binding domain